MSSLRKKPTPQRTEAPPPGGGASVNATATFAVTAITFGAMLLSIWRFGPSGGDSASLLLVGGLLSLFCGGYAGLQELGLIPGSGDGDGSFGDSGD